MSRNRNLGRWLALTAATLIALVLCFFMVLPFLNVLAWAAVLVVTFYPVYRRLLARLNRPGTSAAISCVLVIFVILLPLTFLTLAIVKELSGVAATLQDFIGRFLDPNTPLSGPLIERLGNYVDLDQLRSHEFIEERLRNMGGAIASRTLNLVGGAVGIIIQVVFVIFTMYYLFRDGDKIARALPDVLPLERTQSEEIITRTKDVIGASVYGVLVISAIQGTLGGIAFLLLGLRSPLLWGVVMAFFSMIPMAGAFVVWVPAAIFLAVTGSWAKAIILTVWGALVIGSIDNFLRPKLVGEKTRLHELFIFFSVLGGLHVFGVLGLVLGPVVLAITIALLDVLRHADRTPRETKDESTLVEETILKQEPAT